VCTGVFGKRDVGRIEREFLDVLDFELSITEDDLMAHHDAIMSVVALARHHSHYTTPVPQLGYSSSPSSTESSLSPHTPPTLVESAMGEETHKCGKTYEIEPVQAPQPRHEKRSSHGSTFRILRSLPFPRPFGHSRSESQVPLHNVTQQGRCQLLPPFAAQAPSQVYA
jgi:hypothetical protein